MVFDFVNKMHFYKRKIKFSKIKIKTPQLFSNQTENKKCFKKLLLGKCFSGNNKKKRYILKK